MSATPYDIARNFISILLVGKTGDGKSATCNSIVGQKKFESKASYTSTTKKCQKAVARVQGHNVVVVDSPGLADTDVTTDGGLEQLKQEIINIFATEPDGFDVILIVIRYDRKFTAEDRQVFQELHLLFGKEFVKKRGILLVTHKDKYDPEENDNVPIHEFMKTQRGLFHEMLEQCNNRVIYFDNDGKNELVCQLQVKQLLDMAVQSKQSLLHVIPDIVLKAQRARDKASKESDKPFIDKNTLTGLWLIIYSLEETQPDCRDIQFFEEVIMLLEERCEQLIEQDKGSDRLKDVIVSVCRLEDTIKLRMVAIEKNKHIKEVAEDMSKDLKALQMLLEKSAEAERIVLSIYLAEALSHILGEFGSALRDPKEAPKSRKGCPMQ